MSNYKILSDLDLSGNKLENTIEIIGSNFNNRTKNLTIHPNNNGNGDLILHASDAGGNIKILSKSSDTKGIIITPNTSLSLKEKKISIEGSHSYEKIGSWITLDFQDSKQELTISTTKAEFISGNELHIWSHNPNRNNESEIQAQNLTITKKLTVYDLEVTNNAIIQKNLTVNGTSTLKTLKVTADTTLNTLNVTGNSTLNTSTTTGKATFESRSEFKKGLDITSSGASIVGDVGITGDLTETGETKFLGNVDVPNHKVTTQDFQVKNSAVIDTLDVTNDESVGGNLTLPEGDISARKGTVYSKNLEFSGDFRAMVGDEVGFTIYWDSTLQSLVFAKKKEV